MTIVQAFGRLGGQIKTAKGCLNKDVSLMRGSRESQSFVACLRRVFSTGVIHATGNLLIPICVVFLACLMSALLVWLVVGGVVPFVVAALTGVLGFFVGFWWNREFWGNIYTRIKRTYGRLR